MKKHCKYILSALAIYVTIPSFSQEIKLTTLMKKNETIRFSCKVRGASEGTVKVDFGDGSLQSYTIPAGNKYVEISGATKGSGINIYCPRIKAFLCMDQQLSSSTFSPSLSAMLSEVELSSNKLKELDLSAFPKLNYLRANGNPQLKSAKTNPDAPLKIANEVNPNKGIKATNNIQKQDKGTEPSSNKKEVVDTHIFSEETLIPVRPGKPGEAPFWNMRAVQFLYPPAFDVQPVKEATSYRYTVTNTSGKEYSFMSDKPYAPLTPIWKDIQVGPHFLKVEALIENKSTGVIFERKFHRAAEFIAKPLDMKVPLSTSLQQGLDALVHSKDLACWFTEKGEPDSTFILYRYPSKMVGSAAAALSIYATQKPSPKDAKEALAASKKAADYLLKLCFTKDEAWSYHPKTYHPSMFQEMLRKHRMDSDHYMTSYGAVVAQYLMEVYTATGDKKYWVAIENIAQTYLKKQQKDGTWPLLVNGKTGELIASNPLVPTIVVGFMQKMAQKTNDKRYEKAASLALNWISNNPVKTWNWQGQFEDVRPMPAYQNLTQHEACDFAIYLLEYFPKEKEKIELALDLIRFSEDQFVIWGTPPTANPAAQNSDGKNTRVSRWIIPCVLEQYRCYAPVSASSAKMISSFIAAYKVTKEERYLQKANALAASMVNLQQSPKANGRYETWIQHNPGLRWLNCEVYTISSIQELIQANMK